MESNYVSIRDRNIYLCSIINKESIGKIQEQIIELNKYDDEQEEKFKDYKRTPINIYINSEGGEIPSCLGILNLIENSITPIYTYNIGETSSCGFLILIAGHKRFGYRRNIYLYHQMFCGSYDKFQDTKELFEVNNQIMDMIEDFVASKTKITKEMLKDIKEKKQDFTFFSDKALELGVITEIL